MDKQTDLKLYISEKEPKALRFFSSALPPLALYAALLLVLGELFGMPSLPLFLLIGAAFVLFLAGLPKRIAPVSAAALALLAVLALFLLPDVRLGAQTLVNRLYARSEASNAYAYVYFAQASEDEGFVRAAALCISLLCAAVCALSGKSRVLTVALFLAAAGLQGYFGVTPMLWKNVLLFAAFLISLLRDGTKLSSRAILLLAFAAILLLVLVIAPRPNAGVEAYSEYLRDELGRAAMQVSQKTPPPIEAQNLTHRESRLHEEEANENADKAQNQRQFDRQTENEEEISLPHRTDWLRIILLLLAVIALLVLPFTPFLLLSRAKQKSAEKRAAFADEDNAAAIRAMFRHTVNWLCACGMKQRNRPYADCAQDTQALISEAYAARYAQAAKIWEEAAYSDHALDDAKRQIIKQLMEETEKTLYASSDRKTRLRLKYVACLCEV